MSTAVGAYATLSDVKTRLGVTDTTDDSLLQSLCDQVNQWIETKTGRVLTSLAAFSTTLSASAAAGATTVSLTAATGLSVNDALMLGPVSGTHESVAVQAINGTTITLQSALVNSYSSGATAQRCYIFDGWEATDNQKCLPMPRGVVSMTSLEVATFSAGQGGATTTNTTWYQIPGTDWFLQPYPQNRTPGWPATEVWITNVPMASDTTPSFFPGFSNVRILGTMGWPAIPDDITSLALNLVVGLYRRRGASGGQAVSIGTSGERTIEYLLSTEDWRTINRYGRHDFEVI